VPDYNESRARHEFEKANLAELERKRREGELIERETVSRSLARLMSILRGGLLALPSTLRDRIPHLTPEDIDTAETLIRLQLEELAAGIEADGLPVLSDG
jgi:phage terminase Nu1 subunit (DNA packaging protein)